MKDVARVAGVSLGTVSNVLNQPDLVSPATRRRVVDAIAQLGFVRNESARQLRAGRSRTIGLVVLDVSNPFFTDVARGAETAAAENGSIIMLCNSGQKVEREARYLDLLEEQRVQGVLITPVGSDNARLDLLVARGTPVVLVDRGTEHPNWCSVAVDDVLGGLAAVSHLIERGHRRIAFVGGPMGLRQVSDRHVGAVKAMTDGGRDPGELMLFETTWLTLSSGRQAGERIVGLSEAERPTGVFCANDLLALGVLQALAGHGLRVPHDVAIVGYDDIDYAAAAAVPLSSVRQPRELIGRTATELLLDEMREGSSHQHRRVTFKPELAIRASSDMRRRRSASARTARAARPAV
ncbi:MAG: LacI family transcriptional regulator [Acidimicrobiaceae bacterium]|jgi:LacI family transcriptional regulator|nr:LacI family transcriptional regulator [Acidimicrobiaceae bacterium]